MEHQSVLGVLGINWKQFLAQLFNFGVVLFVFWRYVASPLGKILTDRQKKIESGLKNADYLEKEKENFNQWKMNEMRKAKDEADKIIQNSITQADKAKTEITLTANKQASKIISDAKLRLEQEKTNMLSEARTELASLVVAVSEKILQAKLDEKKDKELIEKSLKEIS